MTQFESIQLNILTFRVVFLCKILSTKHGKRD